MSKLIETKQPLVSIITPSYNQGQFIERTIKSVLNQTYKNIEYIVIDGNSSDNTKKILQRYRKNLYWVSEPDNGQTHAINKGFARAKGDILAYLNSDDIILPNTVAEIVAQFNLHPEIDMIYGDADYIDEKNRFIRPYPTAAYSFSRLVQECCICQPAAFWRKRIAEQVGLFDEKLNYAMDYDYWLRMDKKGGQIMYYKKKLSYSRLHPATKTMSAPCHIYKEILKICNEHAGYVSPNYVYQYLYYQFYKTPYLPKKLIRILPIKSLIFLYCIIRYREPKLLLMKLINLLRKTKHYVTIQIIGKLKRFLFPSHLIIPMETKGKCLLIPKQYYAKRKLRHHPTISIVTPSYNQGQYLEKTIKSVLDQEYPKLEYIIQDGASKDNTVTVLKKYQNQLKFWESKPDEGQSQAINLGFMHATGDIMAYLNSDDLLMPGSLDFVADYFNKHPEIEVVYGHRILINETDLEIGRWVLPPHANKILEYADYIPQETLFWRKSIWDKVGSKIDESFKFAMDWDLIIRFQQAGAKIKRLPRFLGAFRIHQEQKTLACMSDLGTQEMERIRRELHGRYLDPYEISRQIQLYLLKHSFYQKWYAIKAVFSKKIKVANEN